MTRTRIMLAVALTLGIASFNATSADLDGTIEFTGALSTSTCLIEGHPPGQNLAKKDVPLGGVEVGKLTAVGSTAGDRGFNITIGGANDLTCEDGKMARVGFDVTSPLLDTVTGRLNIDGGQDTASNVQIEVINQDDGTPIHMFTDRSHPVEIRNHQAIIPLIARYHSLGAATAGAANSRIGFNVTYD
ncbi:major type 1 subunit fimbrin (pilin) [Luteibacter sp. Sphag1AF]|uniref:fimbrial protein n=1 Tax=Luteibacter sp. Sphag1AF TaxID=2587031 RepID=UPI0017D64AD3|nr:fimbrial protein [Luteibacter sp. Sphag1AF]MBB3227645.1 major type 1 subunit fimbrin (pilin) [Luteibacter sp. Sphag1AF]